MLKAIFTYPLLKVKVAFVFARKAGVLSSPKPVAVPLLAIVAPDGIVIVSPELPSSNEVPDCGSNLSTNKFPLYNC